MAAINNNKENTQLNLKIKALYLAISLLHFHSSKIKAHNLR